MIAIEPYELVKAFDKFVKDRIPASYPWLRAKCEKLSPLLFSILDGEVQAGENKSVSLNLTYTASLRDWRVGDEAAAILSGTSLLILDKMTNHDNR